MYFQAKTENCSDIQAFHKVISFKHFWRCMIELCELKKIETSALRRQLSIFYGSFFVNSLQNASNHVKTKEFQYDVMQSTPTFIKELAVIFDVE